MIITEKQLMLLMDVLKDSLSIVNGFSISQKQRLELCNIILNQQSDKLIDVNK